MKKIIRMILIIIAIIIILGVIFYIIDYNRVKTNKKPIFCILNQEVNDGGTKIYLGLGYKVIDFNTLTGFNKKKIGSYFMNYEDFNDEIEEHNNNLNTENNINNEGITITIEKLGLSNLNNTKICTLDKEEANIIINIINNATFTSETCDGLMSYSIIYNYEDEGKNKSYGIEDYGDKYHIISSNNMQTSEAIITGIEKGQLDNIINKYFN